MYAFQTPPMNPRLFGSIHNYGYSMPPWLEGPTWSAENVYSSTQASQATVSNQPDWEIKEVNILTHRDFWMVPNFLFDR